MTPPMRPPASDRRPPPECGKRHRRNKSREQLPPTALARCTAAIHIAANQRARRIFIGGIRPHQRMIAPKPIIKVRMQKQPIKRYRTRSCASRASLTVKKRIRICGAGGAEHQSQTQRQRRIGSAPTLPAHNRRLSGVPPASVNDY